MYVKPLARDVHALELNLLVPCSGRPQTSRHDPNRGTLWIMSPFFCVGLIVQEGVFRRAVSSRRPATLGTVALGIFGGRPRRH